MKEIEVIQGQSAIDIAIQHYGAFEGVFWLMEDNPIIESIETVPAPGTKLQIRVNEVLNRNNIAVAEHFASYNMQINTGNLESTTGYVQDDYVENEYVE